MSEPLVDPEHSILTRSFEYRVVGFCFHRTLDNSEEAYVDLTLQRGEIVRHLRFLSPRDISIEEGFPESCGMYIADVRSRGLEDLGVRVDDFEASGGAIRFWARAAIDLDLQDAAGNS